MPDFSAITAAAAALNTLTAAEQAEKARIDAAVAAALAATVATGRVVYLDAVQGSDANDGSTIPLAVATPAKAMSLIGAGQDAQIVMLSDVALTAPLSLRGMRVTFSSYITTYGGVSAGGTTPRTLTLTPAASITTNGLKGVPISADSRTALQFTNCNLAIGALQSANCDSAIKPQNALTFLNVGLSIDPNCQVPIISPYAPSVVYAVGLSLPAGYGGKLFAGVAAGANPNSFLVSTNIAQG